MSIDHFSGCTASYSISCIPDPPDYNELSQEDSLRFGFLVNRLRKQGKTLEEAQRIAYQQVCVKSFEGFD